ncbi:MAG: ABC transporter permease [Ostreibacterium sp.]
MMMSICLFIFMIGPIIAIIPISFSSGSFLSFPIPGWSLQWYEKVLQYNPWLHSLINSLVVGSLSAFFATLLGTLAALGFARNNIIGQSFWLGVVISPMIIPLVVSGVAMYFFLAKWGLVATFTGLIMTHTVLAIPYVIIPVLATMQGFDNTLIRAGYSLGATPIQVFFKIILPNIAPGVIAGMLFAFATSFDEIVVALFISGPDQKTLPRQLFDGIRDNIEPSILAMSSILIIISMMMFSIATWLANKNVNIKQ